MAVVCAVGQAQIGGRQGPDQFGGGAQVAELTGRNYEGDGAAQAIDDSVDLSGAPAAGAAYGLGESPPFPPAAQRWALAWVLSSMISAGGPPAAAKVSKASRQTPFFAQRTNRL